MMLKKTAVALALSAGLVAAAHADVTIVDVSPTTVSTFSDTVLKAPGFFADIWAFDITVPTYGSGWAVSHTIAPLFSIDQFTVTLTGPDGVIPLTTSSTSAVGEGLFTPGSWFFTVSGKATGTMGGAYSFAVVTQPVPEPETYAMLLAGLGLVGAVARRRMKNAA
ncbi:MAG: FxDxF family PEP-CTERM protein [Parazoarcus communis]